MELTTPIHSGINRYWDACGSGARGLGCLRGGRQRTGGSLEDRPVYRAVLWRDCDLDAAWSGSGFVGFNAVKMLFYSAVLNGYWRRHNCLVVLLTSNHK